MHLTREERRFELQFVMAGVTVSAGGTACELAVMNVFVAIVAERMRHRSAEIIVFVTLGAVGFRVFAVQRELGFIVIETAGGQNCLPARGRVAGLARALKRCILKGAAMRIGVAILAIGEGQALVMRGSFTGPGTVTPCAGHVLMQPREREPCARMVEALGRFPGVLIVAAQTLGS